MTRPAGGVRLRLAIGLTAVVVAAAGGAALAVRAAAWWAFGMEQSVVGSARSIVAHRALDALDFDLVEDARRALSGGSAARGVAEVVEVRDAEGRVESSTAWPEAIGTAVPSPWDGAPRDSGFVGLVRTASEPRPAWLVAVDGIGGAVAFAGVWLERPTGQDPRDPFAILRAAPAGLRPADGDERPSWAVDLPVAPGAPRWWMVLSPFPLFDPDLDRLTSIAALGALLSALVAAVVGWWSVRAATRPLDAVADAFRAVAEGRADYDFPPARDAAFGEVVRSYSRMRRALDEERARLRAVERVAAWKETARRVAHEVKNPLAPIRLTVENLVKARDRAPARFDRMFDEGAPAILDEVARLQRIVTEFSEYARLPEPSFRPVDLSTIADSVAALHAGDDAVRVRRERAPGAERLPVRADPDLVGQALRNLLDNAVREARAHGGDVVVTSGIDAGQAYVAVRDHGPGFGDADPEHALEPYVTAREGGTGLGLAIAQRIAVEHGGVVRARDADDGAGGACVTFSIPRADGEHR